MIVERFKQTHGNKYDYSMIEFKTMNTKVKIKCNKHNIIFEQTPRTHLIGKTHVCAECIREEVIESFKQIHMNKYDYSLMEYTGALNKIKIRCNKHGVFEQTPNTHKKGQGCPNCSILSQEQVIEQFQEVHGDKYNYHLMEYKNSHTKVKIICKQHGTFEQTPHNHKQGNGCPKCTKLPQEEIIKQFKETHGDKYDYNLMKYTGALNKVKIICKQHGTFEQTSHNHKKGQGCPNCANILTAKEIYQNKSAILYYILINDSQYKVGITKTSINQRYQKEIKDGIDIKIIKQIEFQDGYQAFLLEQEIIRESQDRGTLLKEDCIIPGGYSEVRTLDFVDIFNETINDNNILSFS